MATRLYLPSSGASPLASLAVGAMWETTSDVFFRAPTATAKTNTAISQFVDKPACATGQQEVFGQWVSAPLAAAHDFTAGETVSLVVSCMEGSTSANAHLAFCVRVVSGDGATQRGVLASQETYSTEFATSQATRIISGRALASVSAQVGDRIVIEIGIHSNTGVTSYWLYERFGDPSATGDFALTADLATDLCPWVELSPTLPFSGSTVDDDLAGSHRVMAWAAADDLDGSHLVCAWSDDDLDGSHLVYGVDDLSGSHLLWVAVDDDLAGSHRVYAWADDDLSGLHFLVEAGRP